MPKKLGVYSVFFCAVLKCCGYTFEADKEDIVR